MIDFSHYRDRLSDRAREIIERAVLESQRRQHYFLGVEHIFLAFTIVEGPLFAEVMGDWG